MINGLIDCFKLENPDDLIDFVIAKKLYSKDKIVLSMAQESCYSIWQRANFGQIEIGKEIAGVPTTVAQLLHWKYMFAILSSMHRDERERLMKTDEQHTNLYGEPLILKPSTIDSHCHIDLVMKKYGVKTVKALMDKVCRRGDVIIEGLVTNYCFPD